MTVTLKEYDTYCKIEFIKKESVCVRERERKIEMKKGIIMNILI